MKKILALTAALLLLLVLIGCEGEVTLTAPGNFTITASADEISVVLAWDPNPSDENVDGYIIYFNGAAADTTENTSYTHTDPMETGTYYVTAYAGEDESDLATVDCAPVVTTDLDIYFLSDPDTLHPSGLSFTSSGSATAISVQAANYPDLDYLFDDRAPLTTTTLMSPNAYSPVYNTEKNMGVEEQGITDFDEIDIAAAPGNYSTQTDIQGNAYYSFFMDQDDDDWDTDSDYFGKIYISSITGTHAIITVAYQPITGLRWCVTDQENIKDKKRRALPAFFA